MKENNDGNIPFYIALAVFFIFALLGLTYMIQNSNSYDERGTFGDMFGFANAVFTGLSVVGLIATILLQRKDLNMQREELNKQTYSLHVQNFENTFFQMLTLFHNIVDSTEITIGQHKYRSRSAFHQVAEYLNRDFSDLAKKYDDWHFEENQFEYLLTNEILDVYNSIYKSYKEYLSHYFRTYYHIIKFIHITDNIDKRFYISIARAQLSDHETLLFFYNGLHKNGITKFKPLIEQYAVFNNINEELLVSLKIMDEYKPTAFKYNEELSK